MKLVVLVALVVSTVLLIGARAGEEAQAAPAEISEADVRALKSSQLKAFIEDRGLTCDGCIEKSHFVQKALESRHLPVLAKPEQPKPTKFGEGGTASDDEMEKIMAAFAKKREDEKKMEDMLKKQGMNFGNSKKAEEDKMLEKLMQQYEREKREKGRKAPKDKDL